jgi:fatty acid desaturase
VAGSQNLKRAVSSRNSVWLADPVSRVNSTRTVISNPVQSYFWNNINWHIGHHVYPSVPWYNLQELHRLLEPQIVANGCVVDRSYIGVYWQALRQGPESLAQLAKSLAARRQNDMRSHQNGLKARERDSI